jgi:uncharacterized membrane protein YgdD (TMEM256/DUF423 family)
MKVKVVNMVIAIVILVILSVSATVNLIKSIQKKKLIEIIPAISTIIFLVFMISSLFLGGSANNDAANNYELYEEGCYYLISHNRYTKVTYEQYQYMKIIEPIGIISFLIGFICLFINNIKVKKGNKIT